MKSKIEIKCCYIKNIWYILYIAICNIIYKYYISPHPCTFPKGHSSAQDTGIAISLRPNKARSIFYACVRFAETKIISKTQILKINADTVLVGTTFVGFLNQPLKWDYTVTFSPLSQSQERRNSFYYSSLIFYT